MVYGTPDARARRLEELARERGAGWSDGRWSDIPGGRDDGIPLPAPIDYLAERPHLVAGLSEEDRLVAEGHGLPALGGTLGERLINSASWKAWKGDPQTSMEYVPEGTVVPLARADELISLATTLVFPLFRQGGYVDQLGAKPRWSPLDFFTPIPVDGPGIVRGVGMSSDEPVGFGLNGIASSPEIVLTGAEGDRTLIRWAGHANAKRSLVLDDGVAARLIDEVLARVWFRALAQEALTGDGSTITNGRQQLLGISNVIGINTTAVVTGNYTGALLAAIRLVEAGGFPGPHVLIVNPTDKEKILGHSSYLADRFPTLEAIIGFDKISAGVGFLGQAGAARLYSTPLVIEVSQSHSTNYTEFKITLQPVADLDVEVPFPQAFTKITGI